MKHQILQRRRMVIQVKMELEQMLRLQIGIILIAAGFASGFSGSNNDEESTFSPEDRPVITSNPVQLEVGIGEIFQLSCVVDNLPDGMAILWKRKVVGGTVSLIAVDKTVLPGFAEYRASVIISATRSTITIDNAKSEDAGQYECSLAMTQNPSKVTHTVKMSPRILTCKPYNIFEQDNSDHVYALESSPTVAVANDFIHNAIGDIVEIVCKAFAVPMPTVVWSKDGQSLRSNHRLKISSFGDKYTLTIYRIKEGDFGTYICMASNSLGSANQIIELIELGQDNSQSEEIMVEIELSPSGPWESFILTRPTKAPQIELKQSATRSKTNTRVIREVSFSAQHYRVRFTQKTEKGWGLPGPIMEFVMIVQSSTANSANFSLVLLLCSILLQIITQ